MWGLVAGGEWAAVWGGEAGSGQGTGREMFVGTGDRELVVGIGVGVVGSPSVAEGGLRRMADIGLREEEDRIPASDMVVQGVGMTSCLVFPGATEEEKQKR